MSDTDTNTLTEKPQASKSKGPKLVYVRAVRGELRHLFTNVVFGPEPKKAEIDGFLQAQIDAGKLEIVQP